MVFPRESSTMPQGSLRPNWHVRAVGFIAKPERTYELAGSIEGPVTSVLQELPGFAGAIVLHSRNEPRNLLVLTFWKTEKQAATSCWEELKAVLKTISPMVDVCTKVQTFRATAAAVS
jgi:hypothetical protein